MGPVLSVSLSKVPGRGLSVGFIELYLQNTGVEELWDFTNLESYNHRLCSFRRPGFGVCLASLACYALNGGSD